MNNNYCLYNHISNLLQNKVDDNIITIEFAEIVNELAYDKYIVEAEEDHKYHQRYKELASKRTGIPQDKMVNKKYIKDPKKADLRYKGTEKMIDNDLSLNAGNSYVRKKPLDDKCGMDDRCYSKFFHDIEIEDYPTAIKAINYMKNHSDPKNKKEYNQYKLAFKILCRRFDIDENSSLWIKYYPGNVFKYNGQDMRTPDKATIGAYEDRGKIDTSKETTTKKKILRKNEIKLNLPNGYKLYHKTEKNLLRELKPVIRSTKYTGAGPAKLSGQYHSTGRIYFTLAKSIKDLPDNYGKHIYELVSPVSSIYLDSEHERCYLDEDLNNLNYDKLLGKPIFVKTNTPLKVKQIK